MGINTIKGMSMHYRYIFLVTGLFLGIPLYGNQSPESNHTDKCTVLHVSMMRIFHGHNQEEHHYDDHGNYVSTDSINVGPGSLEMSDFLERKKRGWRSNMQCHDEDPNFEDCEKKNNAAHEAYSKTIYTDWLTISNRINEVALAIAKKRGAEILLKDSNSIYIKPECDITNEAIETINKEYVERKGETFKEHELFNLGQKLHDQLGKDGKYLVELITEGDFSRIVISERKQTS